MYLSTNRLIIRDYAPSDLHDLHEIFSDPKVMEHCEPPYTRQQTSDILQLFLSRELAYAIVHKASRKVIGHLLFHQLPEEPPGVYEIGWFLNRDYWGMGYAEEASRAIMAYGFDSLKLHKIAAETIDSGKACSLMRKLGMTHQETQKATDPQGNPADLYWYAVRNPMEEL